MLKYLKRIIAISMLGILAIGIVGCGNGKTGSKNESKASKVQSTGVSKKDSEDKKELKTVRIGAIGQSNVLSESAGIAQEKGYLEEELNKEGYTAEIIGFAQAGPAINEAFSAKEIDMAVYGDLPATICKASGVDTTIFATENSECQMCIFVQNNSDIESAVDLKGHKVIVARGTIYHQYFKSLIADAGIAESDLEQINTFSDASSVMASKEADALITSTSTGYYLEKQGIGKVVETTQDHLEWTSQFFAVSNTQFLQENPNAAKAFIRALLRTQAFAKDNSKEAFETIASITNGYTTDIYEKVYAYDTSFQYFSPEITEENRNKLKVLEQFLEEETLITSPVDIDSFINTSYYEEVIKEQK